VTFNNPIAHELVGTPLGHALEPTQLFEAAVEFANFILLTWLFTRKRFDGQIFAAYLVLYGVARYLLEFLRDDPGRGEVFGNLMTGTQLISICLVIIGGFIWWLRSGMARAVPARAAR
jgi:phosphatidylglycerol:prolipoprotein diacylglycerol transferase